jgi:hypothetical protein
VLTVHIGQHVRCRFALSDYDYARHAMRPWYAVTDVIGFLHNSVIAASEPATDA